METNVATPYTEHEELLTMEKLVPVYNTGDYRPNSTLCQQHDRYIKICLQHKNVQPFNIPTLPTQSTFEDHTTKWWDKILTIIIWIPPKKTQNVLLRLILLLSHTHRYPGPKAGQGEWGAGDSLVMQLFWIEWLTMMRRAQGSIPGPQNPGLVVVHNSVVKRQRNIKKFKVMY